MKNVKITGKTLIDFGFKPAPWFGEVLSEAARQKLSMEQAVALARKKVDTLKIEENERRARQIPLRDSPLPYRVNITVENEGGG